MFLNRDFPFNPSFKIHIVIGSILGLLLTFIIIVLKPLNMNANISIYTKFILLGFGFIKFLNYLVAHFIERYFYAKNKYWTLWNEIVFLLFSSITSAILAYFYLDLVVEKQSLSIKRLIFFFFKFILPLLPLIIFPKSVLRYLFSKSTVTTTSSKNSDLKITQKETLIFKGQNSQDELVISEEQLLYVKSIDNYVNIYYHDGNPKNKILRTTLVDIQKQTSCLVQPHRSYLINTKQNFKIVGNSQKAIITNSLIKEEIPISRASYKRIKSLVN